MMKFTIYKRRLLIPALLSVVIFTSCKKYLDPKALSSFTPEVVFDNVAGARAALLGAYQPMAGDPGFGIRLSLYYPVDNDEMIGPNGSADNDRRDIAHYLLTPGNLQLATPFNQLYQGVEYSNLCIYYIPKMAQYNNGSAIEKAQLRRMHGEALVLRAQYYQELIKHWGDVPAQWEPSSFQTDLFVPRTNKDSIYDRILSDLELAATLMPWRLEVASIGETLNERFTKGSAKGLRARIALARGGYSLRQNGQIERGTDHLKYYKIAYDECKEIIENRQQHTLLPDYKSIFKDYILAHKASDPSGELMMQVGMAQGSNTDSKLGTYNIRLLPTYFYLFDSTDLRRDVTGQPYTMTTTTKVVGADISNVIMGKFRQQWITNPAYPIGSTFSNSQLNWPLLRFSDVLLMFAEADNEINNGPSPAAIAAVREVSQRGHGGIASLVPTIPTDKAGFFKFLVKERSLELGGEGLRKYDLIRWNLLATAINEAKANLGRMAVASPVPVYMPPSYMSAQPSYATTGFPNRMLYYTAVDGSASSFNLFANSFYKPAPGSTPTGTAPVNWVGTSVVNNNIIRWFAIGFESGKSELFPLPQASLDANPKLIQNPKY